MDRAAGRYGDLLGRWHPGLEQAAEDTIAGIRAATAKEQAIGDTAACVAGPVLLGFVWWVLQEAQKKRVDRLYFLARDGQILYRIAQVLCARYDLKQECRYLYCSRLSLRRASYALEGAEPSRYIFEGGYCVTPAVIFERAGLSAQMGQQLAEGYGKGNDWLNRKLSSTETEELRCWLEGQLSYKTALKTEGERAHGLCLGYLAQEGLLEGGRYGIVDTGWTGSVQQSLEGLLGEGGRVPLEGFYFGLYRAPASLKGRYHCYYLSPASGGLAVGRFNNNLLECFCASPDPMTVGYRMEDGRYGPVFAPGPCSGEGWNIPLQQAVILEICRRAVAAMKPEELGAMSCSALCGKVLERFMYHPDNEEAEAYGALLFCDDMTEGRLTALAPVLTNRELRQYYLGRRLWCWRFGSQAKTEPVYWPAGMVRRSHVKPAVLWRWRFLVWDILHFYKEKRK